MNGVSCIILLTEESDSGDSVYRWRGVCGRSEIDDYVVAGSLLDWEEVLPLRFTRQANFVGMDKPTIATLWT